MYSDQNVKMFLFFYHILPFFLIIYASFLPLSFLMNIHLPSLSTGCGACGEVK